MPDHDSDDAFRNAVQKWYDANARDLPWRRAGVTPWAVLVSEVMLQQTPVARVLPAWQRWMERWPTPASLAAEPMSEAIRAWDRLGYPRRAMRLHQAATLVVEWHGGVVPAALEDLRALPGLGEYTAAAVASFAFGDRVPVLDTNVRRVYSRVFGGTAHPQGLVTVAERVDAARRLPTMNAPAYSVAVMELGALVCTSRSPACDACPVSAHCAWLARGRPAAANLRPAQPYAGTDREVRGRLLARLRESAGPVRQAELDVVWPDVRQRQRALDSLLSDGLVQRLPGARFQLPA
jgi:A/G-specific adenine glycosylase